MAIPSPAVLGIALVFLIFGQGNRVQSGPASARRGASLAAPFALSIIILSTLYVDQIMPSALVAYISTSPWAITTCIVAAASIVTFFTASKARKIAASDISVASWGAFEIALCCMFALNMFFIALPEIRFVWGAISPYKVPSGSFWPSFNLFYSDTQRVVLNPIYDLLRSVLAWYTPEYFLIPLSCMYLMALAIAFFCAGTSPVLGYYGSMAMAAGLCWSKEVLLSVFMVTNLVTLLLTVGLSVWIVSQAFRAVTPSATALQIIRTGLLIGAVGLFSLYAYAASRSVCAPFLATAILIIAWRVSQRSDRRVYYVASLIAIGVIPGIILSNAYYGKWSSFATDLRAGVPSMSSIHNGRPGFIDPNIEASTPDLPAYYGAMIADIPQPDGSTKRDWVYWYRSPSEFARVMWNNAQRVLTLYLPFPGGKAAWFFALVGLVSSMAMMSSRRRAAFYAGVVIIVSLILLAPFLIIPAAGDWRRGVAVVLVFASLAGLGVYRTVGLCFPKVRESMVAVIAPMIIFIVFGRPAIDAIAATPLSHVGIAMVCTFNPVKPLLMEVRKDPRMTGQVLLVGSNEDRCLYSASRQLDAMLGGNRVRILNLPVYELASVKAELARSDSVVLHCGPLTGGEQLKFCAELRSSPEARLVYSAPADGNEIWVITKE